jgi:hypothetical protein
VRRNKSIEIIVTHTATRKKEKKKAEGKYQMRENKVHDGGLERKYKRTYNE